MTFFPSKERTKRGKKSMEWCFLKMISLEWGESGEGINYSKLTYKLLNTLIFADMGSFAVADLGGDSSFFQAWRHSLWILRHAGFLPVRYGGRVISLFTVPTRIIEEM